MIKNEKQYQVAKSRLNDFKESLSEMAHDNIEPLMKELHYGALESQISEFQEQIQEYEALKAGSTQFVVVDNLNELSEILIKARIAKKLSQADLANNLNLKPQQIQRYEMSNYATASMNRISQVINALGLRFDKIRINLNETILTIPSDVIEMRLERIRLEKNLFRL